MPSSPLKIANLTLNATPAELPLLQQFLENHLKLRQISPTAMTHLLIAGEEVFLNIANYAYQQPQGKIFITLLLPDNKKEVELSFRDNGIPYNPLLRPDPDLTLPVNKRPIGGLGIYMTKKLMNQVSYSRCGNCNCLTLKKELQAP